MGQDVQKHLGLTRMSSGCRPAVTVRGSDELDTVELQLEHQRSDVLTAAALQTVTCCWAEYWFYSNAGYVKGEKHHKLILFSCYRLKVLGQ